MSSSELLMDSINTFASEYEGQDSSVHSARALAIYWFLRGDCRHEFTERSSVAKYCKLCDHKDYL